MQDRSLIGINPSNKLRRKLASAIAVAGAVMLCASPMAVASPDANDEDIISKKISMENGRAAIDYWTPSRMENAKSAEALVKGKTGSVAHVDPGKSVKIQGEAASKIQEKAQQKFKGKPSKPSSEPTVSHIGKVFFTLGGADYVCSGNAVVSANEATVSTAGHCVNEGPGAFATKWVFVPAYENGQAPYGTFAASELVAPTEWTTDGDITYDTAFAVVSDQSGVSLTDQVGASGVAFNQPRGEFYSAYGYPAAKPFDGQSLESCSGSAIDDPYGQSMSQGISCDMTGGSSGGPWFLGTGSGGYQNSVNSFGYGSVRNTMFGPYWGSVIEQSYQEAQN